MINISDLHVSYEGEEVLRGIDAAFPEGRISVILGPNGCGKSTLLKSLVRLNEETTGSIVIDGRPLEEYSRNELSRKVAYLPQSRNVPEITVERMVMHGRFPYLSYPRRYRPEDRAKVRESLSWMGLTELAGKRMENLSGGQRQKVYLAMALAQDTDVILMDEPTTFLDIRNQLDMLECVRRLRDEGKTVLMILHDLDLALRYSDHCVLMGDGRVLKNGSPEEVLLSPEISSVFGVEPFVIQTENGPHCFVRAREG